MRFPLLLSPAAAGLLVSVSLPLAAATVYVSTGGTDSAACGTSGAPCKTIQYTVTNRAVGGDVVVVGSGTYFEHVSFSTSLTLRGSGATKTAIDGSNRGSVVTVGGTATMEGLTVQHGKTSQCGGGIVNNGTLTLRRVTVTGNDATGGDIGSGQGGGVCNNGALALLQSTISSNRAEEAGGIFNLGNRLTISGSTISANSTESFGAGLESYGPMTISNSTISGNGGIYGGGIENHRALSIYSSTITNNSAQIGGGIDNDVVDGPQPVGLWNTILSGNSGSYSSPDCSGQTVTSHDYNQIGDTSDCSIVLSAHDVVGADLRLGVLENNGGPTLTILPGSGSAAINGGNPAGCVGANGQILEVDQRGAPRRDARCDVGSVEVQRQ